METYFEKFRPLRKDLLNYLWNLQDAKGHLTDEDVDKLAKDLKISRIELEGVISFYHFFSRTPKGKNTIYLNDSIISKHGGYDEVKKAFEKECGTALGHVDPSGQFGLFTTPCIGMSDQEPAALINFFPFVDLTPEKVKEIVKKLGEGVDVEDMYDKPKDNIQYVPPGEKSIFFRSYQRGISLKSALSKTPEEVIEEIKQSQLSGRGGAFFPTGLKWDFCRRNPSNKKYIVCNADEGEPGTFKDRVLMNTLPGLLLEGMITAGYASGAIKGIIYLRAEYRFLKRILEKEIDLFYEKGLLGEHISAKQPFGFNIRVQMGGGAYVCGEESALLNSLEGRRGEPRTRQYFPVERGYLNKPTIVNNVETFIGAARVMELGAKTYLETGTKTSPGTKVLSISGDCKKPGIYEIEWGTSVDEVLKMCEAVDPFYIQVSGPSGEAISMKEKNRKISKDDLRCGGSFMIFNSKRKLLKILKNYSEFFKHESCGLCTPCRAGNYILGRRLDKIAHGLGSEEDIQEMVSWGNIMKASSRCGLGQTSPNPFLTVIEKFHKYVDNKLDKGEVGLNKEFDMADAIEEYDELFQ